MSRKLAERRTTRVGEMHLCAMCEADAAAAGAEANIKKLTFMLEVPAESVTYVRLAGRCRTWFCRACVEETCRTDGIFAARNAHLVLEVPGWWNEPATAAQLASPRGAPGDGTLPGRAAATDRHLRPADEGRADDVAGTASSSSGTSRGRLDRALGEHDGTTAARCAGAAWAARDGG